MKKLLSLVFFIWALFSFFHKEAYCKDNNSIVEPPNHEIKKIDSREIFGLSLFDAPEEKIFEPMPGETYFLPEEGSKDSLQVQTNTIEESL